MFGFFKKKSKELPSFVYLESYSNRNKYFLRTLRWDWINKKEIHVIDNKSPRVITMGEWPQRIFLDADGQKTVAEYVIWMANQFDNGMVPENFDKSMILTMQDLIEDGQMIELIDEKTTLAYYLEGPKSNQDSDKAYQLMMKDGYIEE